jgi:hypothetical protein
MQQRQLFDKVRFLDCLAIWYNIGSNPISSTSFICREYLHTAVKTYADYLSEAMQIATKWPFRESAKMQCMREGHIHIQVWQINTFAVIEGYSSTKTFVQGSQHKTHDSAMG